MNEEIEVWPDKQLSEPQQRNRDAAALIPVTRSGAIPMNFAQMVDYAKFMSTARGAVGAHLMGNVGACLAVMEIANQFGLPAYAVARQSYLVNNRIAFMGQFFHSIVEDYAPLEKGDNGRKLQFRFEGEGNQLKVIVSAMFKGASKPVEYESPTWANVKVKNSPLWETEPRRQFIYFGVRGWQTTNWPEGMMHAISDDEAAALPPSDLALDITPKLGARLIANPRSEEGFQHDNGHVESELSQLATDKPGQKVIDGAPSAPPAKKVAEPKPEKKLSAKQAAAAEAAKKAAKAAADRAEASAAKKAAKQAAERAEAPAPKPAPVGPQTADEYVAYAHDWIEKETDPGKIEGRWDDEGKMRDECQVPIEVRKEVMAVAVKRVDLLNGN